MNTDNLTALLNNATDSVEAPPGFTETVLRSGRRRQARRRLTVAASAVLAVALVGGGAYLTTYQDTEQVAAANPLLGQPTKGVLAGDQNFVAQAKELWRTGLLRSPEAQRDVYDDMRGEPHVYWAGETPAGRAAVVVQQVYVHQNDQLHLNAGGERLAVGLVATDDADGELKLVTDQWQMDGPTDRLGYFRFGPDDRTVLIVTLGKPVFYSPEPKLRDHTPVHDWQRMQEFDGVAVATLPDGVNPDAAIVVERDTQPADTDTNRDGSFSLTGASAYLGAAGKLDNPVNPPGPTGIRWLNTQLTAGGTGGPQFDIDKTYSDKVAMPLSYSGGGYMGVYYVRAVLPDGRVAVVSDIQNGAAPARFYALLVTPDMKYQVYDGGDVNAAEPLPVHFRMPDEQGWVIAQLDQPLKYRTAVNGEWVDAGTSAAVVPDETVQVMVGTTIVDLPR